MSNTDTADERRLLTVEQARDALGGISRSTMFELMRRGELASAKIGRRRFIRPEDLDAYIARLFAAGAA